MRPSILLPLFLLVACTQGEAARSTPRTPQEQEGSAPADSAADSAAAAAAATAADTLRVAPAVAALRGTIGDPGIVRGLYVNRFAAQSRTRMSQLVAIADTTEINAFVIDIKDEFGLNYRPSNQAYTRFVGDSHGVIRDVKALVDTLHAHGIMAIARIVVFKDPVAAAADAAWQIKTPAGATWRDEKGNAWVNPYHRELWEYNIAVAEEMVTLGFDEIQWDYIRFPEPYKRLATQVFPGAGDVKKPDALAAFLKEAKARINRHGVRSTADVFGLVTNVRGPLEIGQWWEKVSPVSDVLLPMVYPSHYPRNTLGVRHPNAQPYDIIRVAIDTARVRDERLGIRTPEHVRPWLQAFTLGKPPYEAHHVREQKRAVYDAGFDGWVLWHPGSKYEPFLPALERETATRKTRAGEPAVR